MLGISLAIEKGDRGPDDRSERIKGQMMPTEFFDMPITTNQIKSVLDFLHDGLEERMEKRPGNAARAARDRISIARSNVRVQNGLSRSRDRQRIESAAG